MTKLTLDQIRKLPDYIQPSFTIKVPDTYIKYAPVAPLGNITLEVVEYESSTNSTLDFWADLFQKEAERQSPDNPINQMLE